jgi:hypothetical protein
MTITDVDLDARVARGAALFDEKFPGWADRIDLAMLDVSSTRDCPAGQVVCNAAGDDAYQDAMDELGFPLFGDGPADHGFILSITEHLAFSDAASSEDKVAVYAPLTEAWRRAAITRRGES